MEVSERELSYIQSVLEVQNYKTRETINKVRQDPAAYIDDVSELEERICLVDGILAKLQSKPTAETSRYCSISTAHLTRETDMLLQKQENQDNELPIYFPKRINGTLYGYIFVAAGWDDSDEARACCPEDLKACLQYAQSIGCDMLVIDGDCNTVPGLPVYDWNSHDEEQVHSVGQ